MSTSDICDNCTSLASSRCPSCCLNLCRECLTSIHQGKLKRHLSKLLPTFSSSSESSQSSSYHPFLTPTEKQDLSKKQHALDFPLTEAQLRYFDEFGFIVLEGLIEPELCQQIVKEIFVRTEKFFGVKRTGDALSENNKKLPYHGCIDIWHVPSIYHVRQDPRVYSIFSQLLKTHKLAGSIDRVSVKPPIDPSGNPIFKDIELHTDVNPFFSCFFRPRFQGGLCLEDCPNGGGGLFVVPGFHKRIGNYVKKFKNGELGKYSIPPPSYKDFIPFGDESERQRMIEIPLKRGDFVIWNSFVPHNSGPNTLSRWRLHAFVSFVGLDGPTVSDVDKEKGLKYLKTLRKCYRTGLKPDRFAIGTQVKRTHIDKEIEGHAPPPLSWLGKRLFGEVEWE